MGGEGGCDALMKRRDPKAYRISELDLSIRESRTRKEAKIMARARMHNVNVPDLFGVSNVSIYMEKLNGKLLNSVSITAEYAKRSGELLASLHNAGMVHGDFTPANIIAGKDGRLYLIDFGLSEASQGIEERALDLLLMKRQLNRKMCAIFIKAYAANAKSSNEAIRRLEKIEERGRYQTRTLA